ncbi:MAG: T9SS type A sorting domain-containing protein [Flavobacteriales bacterium]|nr:T9SS type A sorting domain-containing protein [Flavobacteriales bacterium]MCB9194512.1 T9SS type A sorting domain-containing protein [Flavobacteriales bacterium]
MLAAARANGLYVQLCIDPNGPGIDYENYGWGANPYVMHFLEPSARPYDLKKYFYQDGDTANKDVGVFYYWKRKYKYMMARWGYSVNLAVIEPFNEVDQMLSYRDNWLAGDTTTTLCSENLVDWPADPDLPGRINDWLTDIISYVKDPVDLNDPVHSPLGEEDRLFLMSYTDVHTTPDPDYHAPFSNPRVDLVDVHRYHNAGEDQVSNTFAVDSTFRAAYLKPFHNGESGTWGEKQTLIGGQLTDYDGYKIFDNYDVSFHNELWSSAFSGNFTVSPTWFWERVFWWKDALPAPPSESITQNPFGLNHTDTLGGINILYPNGDSVHVRNRTIYHNFKPLSDLLAIPNWQTLDFFNGDFSAHKVYDETNKIECYYLRSADSTLAIGWVHNLNAYWENHYYIKNTATTQNFFGCTAPNAQQVSLPGFAVGPDYYITYFPTRMNDTIHPADSTDHSGLGTVLLDLSTAPLGDTVNHYLDTLHLDYAFIISATGPVKSLFVEDTTDVPTRADLWNFEMYPNPAQGELKIVLHGEGVKDVALYDLAGREVMARAQAVGPLITLPIGQLSRGPYCVRVADATSARSKTLIVL